MNKQDWRTRPVAGIGIVGLDHVAVTDRWERDTKSTATHYFEQVGGPVPVALMAMARLGLSEPPRFWGRVGKDLGGNHILRELKRAGLNVEGIRQPTDTSTGHSLVVLDTSIGTRTLTNFPAVLPERLNSSFDYWRMHSPSGSDVLNGAGLLHTDGRGDHFDWFPMTNFREQGGIVSLDLGSPRPLPVDPLYKPDIVIASKVGGAGTFPDHADEPTEQTKRFLDLGATVAGVTLGADGVVIGSRDENGGDPVHLPAFLVENVVDTCGAGDLFHGAFLWAYRGGKTVFESATFAQAAVALRIQHYGNAAGQPTREQVEAFLAAAF